MNMMILLHSRVKILARIVLVVALCVGGCAKTQPAVEVGGPVYTDIGLHETTPDLIKQVVPERWTLPNGLTVVFLEDNELPLVSGTLYLRGGSLWEGEDEVGAVGCMGDQMRSGGAGKRTADEMDHDLEMLSAGISSSFGQEFGFVNFSCLSSDIETVFSMFSDVVIQPVFERNRLNLWKGQAIEAINRRKDDPGTIAGLSMRTLLYDGTPYGRVSTDGDIKRINSSQLKQLHAKWVKPDGAVLAVSGKISRRRLEELSDKYFGRWQAQSANLTLEPPPVDRAPSAGIYFVRQPLSQATVFAGILGVPRLTPDYLAIDVFNSLYGSGGFGSLLARRVRSEMGLAYSVYGGIIPAVVKGKNLIVVQTRADQAALALSESIKILNQLKSGSPDGELVEENRRGIANSFVFNFSSLNGTLRRRVEQELLNYPGDYDVTYIPGIMAVKPAEISQVAKNRWDLSQLVVVVVGNEEALHSIEELRSRMPEVFGRMPVREVTFDQKLNFN